jgi:hypothetical protein
LERGGIRFGGSQRPTHGLAGRGTRRESGRVARECALEEVCNHRVALAELPRLLVSCEAEPCHPTGTDESRGAERSFHE